MTEEYKFDDNDPRLVQMNEKYCVVNVSGKTRVLWFERDMERWLPNFATFQDFLNFHCNQKMIVPNAKGKPEAVSIAKLWLASPARRTYSGITFQPNGEAVVGGRFNLWRGWGVDPAPGDWSLMRAHIKDVIAAGNEEFDAYLIGWIANMFQNPGQPGQVAPAIRSEREGIGKGTLFNALVKTAGQHGIQISSTKHLAGNFNFHLQDCIFLFADEALWPGDKASEGTLSRLITEPTLFIEPKNFNAYSVKNCLHVALASNQDWIVPAKISSRRFAVNEASSHRVGDRAYFKALHTEMNNGGLAAMLYDLLRMDLSTFDVNAYPKTAALRQQQILSLSPFDQWWVGLLEEGRLPGQAIIGYPNRAYTYELLQHAKEKVPSLKYLSDILLGRILGKKMGCKAWKKTGGGRGWEFPTLSEARQEWEKKAGKWDWGDDEQKQWELPLDTSEDHQKTWWKVVK